MNRRVFALRIILPIMLVLLGTGFSGLLAPLAQAPLQGSRMDTPRSGDTASPSQTDLPAGASADWWGTVQKNIRAEEYRLSRQSPTATADAPDTWSAPNRAQGFNARFSSEGLQVIPSETAAAVRVPAWEWGLELVAWGRPEALTVASAPSASAIANRFELARPGLTEWFVNDERGIEHGFAIPAPPVNGIASEDRRGGAQPPPGAVSDKAIREGAEALPYGLAVDLRLSGTLHPRIAEDGQAVDFYDSGNISVIHYASLQVTDATGRILPSHFEGYAGSSPSSLNPHPSSASAGGLRIAIDDAGALYPLTVDPLATSPSWTTVGEATNDLFGFSLAPAGDVNGDGYSDVVIGADGYSTNTGKAYLYLGGPSGPSTTASWAAVGEATGNYFGRSVATAGDINGDGYADVVIGAYGNATATGKAYLYLGGPSGLSGASSWTAAGQATNDYFGWSVATAGDVNGDGYSDVVVGAYDNASATGKAYLYLGGPSGLSTGSSWTASGEAANNYFGQSVATAGDANGDGYSDVVIGAYGNSSAGGKAYLYLGGPSGLSASSSWTAVGEAANNFFGESVATAGDVNGDGYSDVVVGAQGASNVRGKAYLYLGGPAGLSATTSWTVVGENIGDRFGLPVATAGDVNGDGYSDVIVGAYAINSSRGKAYLYLGGSAGLSATASWTAVGQAVNDQLGWSLATAGDVDGDGYSDVVVGARGYSSSTGKVYLYLGGANGISATSSWAATGETTSDLFGVSVATAGDVNGDGYSDVVVGANAFGGNTGKAYLYLGGPSGLSATSSWTAEGAAADDFFGVSVATAGDVNGDGYSDVAVGAMGYSSSTGKVYLYLGGANGISATSSWTAVGQATGDQLGCSVASAGDVNGDGYSDVVVGARGYNGYTGKAHLYIGSASGLSAIPSWTAVGVAASDWFGFCVATVGDVNGDGHSDVVVGGNGKAYLYLGNPSGLSTVASWATAGELGSDFFGWSVASAGDVNADGYSDLVVGAPSYGTGMGSQLGKAYLYLGGMSGLSPTASWTALGEAASNNCGYSVATAGDVNGDGYSDVVVGALGNGGNTGKAYAYLGGGGPGVPMKLQQLRADLSAPIAPLGLALGQQFRMQLLLRTPYGRGNVKLQWQALPLGASFLSHFNPIQSESQWLGSGAAGVTQQKLIALPDPPGPYKWRARVKYHTASSPFQSYSRWFTPAANGQQETDLRGLPQVSCVLPDEPCWIYSVVKSGTDYTLNFQDPNQANQRTGWNIHRSNTPAPPKSTWPLVGSNVVDMDQATQNYQWTDTSAADPAPGLVWYFQVTAYNANCPAEGPF